MKKIIKNRIFIVIITMIICISGTLYATTKYQANEVIYNPSSGDSMTVNDALNEIYNIKTLGDATSENISSGKTVVVKGKLITGTGIDSQKQYDKGYADGLANANNGKIVYEYHYHSSKCQATCNAYYTRSIVNNLGNDKYTAYVTLHHTNCGKGNETNYWTVQGNDFNGQTAQHIYYTCGYEEGELIGAKIEFD